MSAEKGNSWPEVPIPAVNFQQSRETEPPTVKRGERHPTLSCAPESAIQYQCSKNRSASKAAIQPDPAAVIAWR